MIALLLFACSDGPSQGVTETGNPELVADVSMRARSSDPGTISVRGNGDVNVDSLWLAVKGMELFPAAVCEDNAPSFIDPFVSDATARVPQVQRGRAVRTSYCGARITLDPTLDPGDGPDALAGHTLVMTGTTEERRPFLIRTSLDFDVVLSRDEGNFMLDETHDQIEVGFDVSIWLDEIWIDDGFPSPDGTIVIDENNNVGLLQDFEGGLLDSMDIEIVGD